MILTMTYKQRWMLCYARAEKSIVRARLAGRPALITAEQLVRALQYWDDSCAYCGVSAEAIRQRLTFDHVIPLCDSASPGSTALNLLPCCHKCNTIKGGLHPVVWLAYQFDDRAPIIWQQIQHYFDTLR